MAGKKRANGVSSRVFPVAISLANASWGSSRPAADAASNRAEGYRLAAALRGDRPVVWIVGADRRGLIYGVGGLLRALDWAPKAALLPRTIDVAKLRAEATPFREAGRADSSESTGLIEPGRLRRGTLPFVAGKDALDEERSVPDAVPPPPGPARPERRQLQLDEPTGTIDPDAIRRGRDVPFGAPAPFVARLAATPPPSRMGPMLRRSAWRAVTAPSDMFETPITFRIEPRALRVLLPHE